MLSQKISYAQSQAPFNTLQKRQLYSAIQLVPGPGQYDPKTNVRFPIQIEDRLQEKVKQGLQGNFGSKVEKDAHQSENQVLPRLNKVNPGPGYYVNPDIIAFQNYQDVVAGRKSHFFQSQIQRNIWKSRKDKTPDCCSYEVKNYNISKKYLTSDNFAKKAAFMTKQSRFNYEAAKEGNRVNADEAEEEPLGQERKTQTSTDFFRSTQKSNVPFNSKVRLLKRTRASSTTSS
jgi:hypothetical protein